MTEIPTHIDEPQMVFTWTIDEFLVGVALLGFGIIFDYLTISAIVAYVVVRFYKRHRENHARGYLEHLTYRYGLFLPKNSKTFPNPFIRFFSE